MLQRHSGLTLCRECFLDNIRLRVKREVEAWEMITGGDVVAMGLSGGKDSYVLLDTLARLHKPSRLFGISIIEGIPGYNRPEDVKRLVNVARDLGVDVIVTSIRDYVGKDLYDIVVEARRRGVKYSACTFCGLSRRRILNVVAREHGATKLATAHNLDDEVQTLILNIIRGDVVGLIKAHPRAPTPSDGVVVRIKPLRKIYEWETSTYAYLMGFPLQETECMFINQNPTLRARVREALYLIEDSSPGTLLRLLEYVDSVLGKVIERIRVEGLSRCAKCGEPTSPRRSVCKLCELLEMVGLKFDKNAAKARLRMEAT